MIDLSKYDVATLARWEAVFNIHQWPDDYPLNAPDDPAKLEALSSDQWRIIANSNLVPYKESLRAHNTVISDRMTNEEFESWWSARDSNREPSL